MYETAEGERKNTRRRERRDRNVAEIQVISKRMKWNNINEGKEIYIEHSDKTAVDKKI
jgi:hypothetical protein